ncbi:hypothetical protein J2Y69_000504 [Microbacterium resistens]|uniref:Uncharacterized protein n=1 Tax=Microbacterium resistens TaxID=156977 RepID=A0ABU1S8H3_9MICO|nr:hypothetical protein [Microbacterium resistens]MDR6865919.1 hypothetical protein [Microbacterium resistens]
MSLMHTMAASRHLLVTDLFEPPHWPLQTTVLPADVLFHRDSLAAEGRQATPLVRIGAAAPADTERSHQQRYISIVVAAVTAVDTEADGHGHGPRSIAIDADLHGLQGQILDARVIGRRFPHRTVRARLHDATGNWGMAIRLPRDIAVGDLLAIPCEGIVSLGSIRPPHRDERDQSADDAPHCARHIRSR